MVKNLFTLLSSRQTTILSGAFILMLTVFASKFLGLIRDRLLVHQFNTTEAAIFFASFRLPDLLFQLLIFGALSVAFIPVFTDHLHHKGEKEAFEFAGKILNLAFLIFAVFATIAFFWVDFFNGILVPGFSGSQKIQTNHLTQIVLLGQLILVIGSFFIGIAQSYQRFIIPALASVFYNLGVIIGILVFSPHFGIAGPAYGVVIGAALHVLIQFPLINSLGFRYNFSLDFLNSGVKEIFKMMSARNIGLAFEQISETVSFALASLVSYSSVTILTLAQHLMIVPVGLFGATIAQAALPVLSRAVTNNEKEEFKATLLTTMHQILFLTLPSAAILIVLRIPVVRLVFGASQFNWADTVLTGYTVSYLSLGLAAQAVILLLVRGFYALKDTKTPVMASILTVLLNVGLSLWFVRVLKIDVWGLGLAYSISTIFSLFLLLFFLHRKVGGFDLYRLTMPGLKMLLAALVAAIALYVPVQALDQLVFDTTRTINLISLTAIASFFGLSIYLILIWLLRVEELYTFINLLKKVNGVKTLVKSKEIVENPTDTVS